MPDATTGRRAIYRALSINCHLPIEAADIGASDDFGSTNFTFDCPATGRLRLPDRRLSHDRNRLEIKRRRSRAAAHPEAEECAIPQRPACVASLARHRQGARFKAPRPNGSVLAPRRDQLPDKLRRLRAGQPPRHRDHVSLAIDPDHVAAGTKRIDRRVRRILVGMRPAVQPPENQRSYHVVCESYRELNSLTSQSFSDFIHAPNIVLRPISRRFGSLI